MQSLGFPRRDLARTFAAQQRFAFGESESLEPKRYRAGWISDAHLGTRGCNAAALLDFLRANDFEILYIVGDLIDIWSLRRGIYWPQQHNDVIQKILRKARKGTHVIYIPGNHDELVADFCGAYGNIDIKQSAIHVTACGERILIIHGHELDTVVQNVKWLAFAGDVGYQFFQTTLWSWLLVAQRVCEATRERRREFYRQIRSRRGALCGTLSCGRRTLWSHPQPGHPGIRQRHVL